MSPRKSFGGNAPRSRTTIELSRDLERGLRFYVAAAVGVAGFTMLASLPSAAEVVYTATHKVLQGGPGETFVNLDLNNDGQTDFTIAVWMEFSHSSGRDVVYGWMSAVGNGPSNLVVSSAQGYKAALPAGAQVGPDQKFGSHSRMASCASFTGRFFSSGPWRNVSNRYLGFKFSIDGQTHYGWARFNATGGCFYTLTLTGYAYQTEPDQPITIGPTDIPIGSLRPALPSPAAPEPASLGSLALGASGLAIWRRE